MRPAPPTPPRHRLHGLKLSYFTGKLEGYFRCKGVPFDFVEMDLADFRACARATGVAQMPQVHCPDGSWLTDTTAIIAQFEAALPSPRLHPISPAARFVSLLLEDMFDEWLWRPALYYRWAFSADARLMSGEIARTLLRTVPAPLWLARRVVLARQRRVYLREDGVTPKNGAALERLYARTLDALQPILHHRPFLLGDHPCEADFGLFGPFFRHFSSDPTPAAILREQGPAVLAWLGRLWAATPQTLAQARPIADLPSDLGPVLAMAHEYLAYLAANAAAIEAGAKRVAFQLEGAPVVTPVSPYRAHCLAALQAGFQALGQDADAVAAAIGPGLSLDVLNAPPLAAPTQPRPARPLDRHWRA